MNAWEVVLLVFRDDWLRFNLILVIANVIFGLAVAIFTNRESFYLGEIANWLGTRILPFFMAWGGAKLMAIAAFGEYTRMTDVLVAAISAFVTAALVGKIVDNLRGLGIPIPEFAGSKPKPETRSTP